MTHSNPLASGNLLQRSYYRWARPRYERIGRDDPALALEIEEVDQFLYSRRGVWAWVGWFLGWAGLLVGLRATGAGWSEAIAFATLLWVTTSLALLGAWFSPRGSVSSKGVKRFAAGLLLGVAGVLVGFVTGQWLSRDEIDWERLHHAAEGAALPALLLLAGMTLLISVVSWAGRKARELRLQRLQLLAERDAARATAAETELRLLQAQIHPHFVFNTLATLQHWVDKGDPRAGPLLHALTGFLRGSTEMLGRPLVPLREEAQAVGHYLAIMQARMGERLRFEIDLDPGCAEQMMPPGLLLTLVENAIEHGLEPKIGGGMLSMSSGRGAGGWWLRVQDDGAGLSPQARDQVGLSNLRQRLQQHYGARARFTLQPLATGGVVAELRFEDPSCPVS